MKQKQIEKLAKYLYDILCIDYRERFDRAYNDKNDKRDGHTVVMDCIRHAEFDVKSALKMALDKFNDPGDENK